MFLYKLEIDLGDRLVHLVVIADGDEQAFNAVEGHLARHFVKSPEVKEATIVEKKRVEKGAGYIIE